jgi:hypothetical protein
MALTCPICHSERVVIVVAQTRRAFCVDCGSPWIPDAKPPAVSQPRMGPLTSLAKRPEGTAVLDSPDHEFEVAGGGPLSRSSNTLQHLQRGPASHVAGLPLIAPPANLPSKIRSYWLVPLGRRWAPTPR